MPIIRMNLLGSPNIGVYALTTNYCTIVPATVSSSKAIRLENCLKSKVICTTICNTSLIGVFAVANSNGIALPYFTSDEEVQVIKSLWNGNVERIDCKSNALGNLILANDKGAIIGEPLMIEKEAVKKIRDVLGVELVQGTIAGLHNVGSLAIATNKGGIAHPLSSNEELKVLRDVLKIDVDVGTINGGIPFVPSGILANDNGVIIGSLTTGPEILMLSNILGG